MSDTTGLRQRKAQDASPAKTTGSASEEKKAPKITLFNSPFKTVYYFGIVVGTWIKRAVEYVLHHRVPASIVMGILAIFTILYFVPGAHQPSVQYTEEIVMFVIWWVGLGVASSIGLGTGLHTFVLYLGPHIAKLTMAATECNEIPAMLPSRWNFNSFAPCSDNYQSLPPISFWDILMAVQWEAFLWGLGTAIGELPPYFVARAARLSGEKLKEWEELEEVEHAGNEATLMDKVKKVVLHSLEKFGFLAIMIFASIPNPLFDLAGITCGHFLIPFRTFFGATIIGKAIIKVHIQMLFVIAVFSKHHVENLISFVESLHPSLNGVMSKMVASQRAKLHNAGGAAAAAEAKPLVGYLWDLFVGSMILFFLVSIVNSTVQEYLASQEAEAKLPAPAPVPVLAPAPVPSPEDDEEEEKEEKKTAPASPPKKAENLTYDERKDLRRSPRIAQKKAASKKAE